MISDEYNEVSENKLLYQQQCHTIPANGSSGRYLHIPVPSEDTVHGQATCTSTPCKMFHTCTKYASYGQTSHRQDNPLYTFSGIFCFTPE